MFTLVENCSRCKAREMTLDVPAHTLVSKHGVGHSCYELFAVCRNCRQSTVFKAGADPRGVAVLTEGSSVAALQGLTLNNTLKIFGPVSLVDVQAVAPPGDLPPALESAFQEGARSFAIACYSAAGAMFRLCIDLASEPLLPPPEVPGGPNYRERRDLGLRLPWLFANKLLAEDLHDLAHCVKEDGNDAAHRGTLTKADAEDLLDFTRTLLERLYSQPAKVAEAKRRRDERRNGPPPAT